MDLLTNDRGELGDREIMPKFLDNKRGAMSTRNGRLSRLHVDPLPRTAFLISSLSLSLCSLDRTQFNPSPESTGRRVAAEL